MAIHLPTEGMAEMIPVILQPEPGDFDAKVRISANSNLSAAEVVLANKTIKRLKMNTAEHKKMQTQHFVRYLRKNDEATLKELSPFVWYEARRQNLL